MLYAILAVVVLLGLLALQRRSARKEAARKSRSNELQRLARAQEEIDLRELNSILDKLDISNCRIEEYFSINTISHLEPYSNRNAERHLKAYFTVIVDGLKFSVTTIPGRREMRFEVPHKSVSYQSTYWLREMPMTELDSKKHGNGSELDRVIASIANTPEVWNYITYVTHYVHHFSGMRNVDDMVFIGNAYHFPVDAPRKDLSNFCPNLDDIHAELNRPFIGATAIRPTR